MMQHNSSRVEDNGETNLALLQRRYASGEITKEQYEDARQALGM